MAVTAKSASATETALRTAVGRPAATFDEVFVLPVDAEAGRSEPPALPEGWRHAAVTTRLANQPQERRETVYAGLFALAGFLWAPLGIIAVLADRTGLFFLLSLLTAAALFAPRPTDLGDAVASVRERVAAVAAWLRDGAEGLADRVGQSIPSSSR